MRWKNSRGDGDAELYDKLKENAGSTEAVGKDG